MPVGAKSDMKGERKPKGGSDGGGGARLTYHSEEQIRCFGKWKPEGAPVGAVLRKQQSYIDTRHIQNTWNMVSLSFMFTFFLPIRRSW